MKWGQTEATLMAVYKRSETLSSRNYALLLWHLMEAGLLGWTFHRQLGGSLEMFWGGLETDVWFLKMGSKHHSCIRILTL